MRVEMQWRLVQRDLGRAEQREGEPSHRPAKTWDVRAAVSLRQRLWALPARLEGWPSARARANTLRNVAIVARTPTIR